MTQVVKVAKIGKSADSTDPNDFIFHSDYNTFKIIIQGTTNITLLASTNNQSFTQKHNLDFIPLVSAFAKRSGTDYVFLPNGVGVDAYGAKAGALGDITFNYISTDNTNITFNFDNTKTNTVNITIKYYILEAI